ncbi:MAG: anti-sigma factor [Desulfococcaceae bacterium]
MKCRNKGKKISAYLDGELDAEKAGEMEKHLSQCAECRQTWNDFKHADSLLAGLPPESVGDEFVRNLMMKTADIPQTRTWASRMLYFFAYFFDTLFAIKKKNNGTLDEFGDFPPCSLGRIYFNLL